VKFPAREPGNEFVARLWATRRVGWLLDEIRLRGESAELRAEIVDLARRHAIVTPYTSFLIVEDEVRRGVPAGQRSLPGLEGDRFALDAFGGGWANTGRAKSGDAAARDARANAALRNAEAASGALDAAVEESKWSIAAQNTAEPAAPAGVDRQVASLRHAARVVAGKAFYRNGSSWIDSDVQARPPVQTVRLQFASAAYFEFLAGNAWAAPWLALGSELQFTVGDTLYDIVP
jgi:Ca-activated chloride channel family protein